MARRGIRNKGIQGGFDVVSEIEGIDEIAEVLKTVVPKEANNLLRATVDGVAGEIRKKARANARTHGLRTISKAIKSRRKKSPPGKPVSQVFVEHGAGAKHDAWFWHFHEFGTDIRFIETGRLAGQFVGRVTERAFIRKGFKSVTNRLDLTLREQFQKKLTKRIERVKKLRAKI
ncbi:MAG: hypothetical protein GWM98_15390 [Nitrospinaceae bacterium]|nr:hypothetical protein [Nitrospinaceae bacterium]NIR55608.1 hypothetical protein [Nitrospinaceae bacterium]NIS86042.1 hypothetical protein [Nitrospinaceae bacterium]NIT82885.1 hypothetical protein [Nitrospinaceae bacterium]NIU45090.1 hypothetical protein [Nitrospinaceae bacterium]